MLAAAFAVNYFEFVRSGKLPHRIIGYGVLAPMSMRILWDSSGRLHALGVVHASWLHRENLVLSMFTGRKRVQY